MCLHSLLKKFKKPWGKYAISNVAEMKKLVICLFPLKHTDAALNVIQYAYLCQKTSHSQIRFFICFIFLLTLLQQVLFRISDNPENQIIISTYK